MPKSSETIANRNDMPRTDKQREQRRLCARRRREKVVAEGKAIYVEGRVVVKELGLRVIVSTFNKYNVETINLDCTVNCEGGKFDGGVFKEIELDLKRCINEWVFGGQQDYETRYIAIVNAQDNYNKEHNGRYVWYVPKNKHIKIDLTLKLKKQLPWKEVVEKATEHIHYLYDGIARTIECSGLKLKDFKGHNLKSGVTETA